MRFRYKVIWVNTVKNRQEFAAFVDQETAIFVAKKKLTDGSPDVVIQITQEDGDPVDDPTWPAIEAEVKEIKNT